MPVVRTAQVSYTFLSMDIDMQGPCLSARLIVKVDGKDAYVQSISAADAAMYSIIATMPTPGKTRADDLTDAIYAYGIASGQIAGEIV